ncbi:MAG TPA: NAD(P)/FAD-dependent oxidoreductase [Acidimicrobiales bacterium]|nr:NAD(P)/FAD-dependent oxidoreductase [Acidimicrobiales bacterium]
MSDADAVVVGSGPNGLAAAVVLAAAGLRVRVYECAESPGGGCRTEELTLPGFRHDVCSAVHPLVAASGFFRRFGLERRGVRLIEPEVAYAHPLDGRHAAAARGSVDDTAADLGPDAAAYRRLFGPTARHLDDVAGTVLSSMRAVPRHPLRMAAFGSVALRSASSVTRRFQTEEARAMFAGVAAHSMLRLDRPVTGGIGLFLGSLAHGVGWPVVARGSAALTGAMVEAVVSAGGEVVTGRRVRSLDELAPARAVLLDVTPRALLELAGDRLPAAYRRSLGRFRYGAGVCKVDWALEAPVPWRAEPCRRAATVHLGGTFEEIACSEADVAAGRHAEAPYVLVVQPGVVDPSRAPAGCQTLWTYCHVPAGSDVDMTEAIAAQVERFAPGFRDTVLARSTRTAAQMAAYNPNYLGGDIGAGTQDLRQTFLRPAPRWNPYRTPLPGVYLCSASTPPGPGVHGRCGELAALSALRDVFGVREPPDLAPRVPDGTPAGPFR